MLSNRMNMSAIGRRCRAVVLSLAVLIFPLQAIAQAPEKDADELSKELVNPVGPNWLINTYLNLNKKKGEISGDTRTATEWLIQPVMPVPLDDKPMGMTLMNRPTLPIVLSSPLPQTDSSGEFSGFNTVSGFGDLMIQTAIGSMPPAPFGMYMWGAGIALMFPTASDDDIGSGKYSAGPSGMLFGFTDNYTFGVVVNQLWSYAGDNNRKDVNQAQFQPVYFRQLGNGWQLGDNPTWSVKWDNDSGNKYDVPIGLGIFKTTFINGTGWKFGVTPRVYLKSYNTWGNDWGVSFTITPVLKNPVR